jgi:predicted aldo/keto reductase-like oxidoreductase
MPGFGGHLRVGSRKKDYIAAVEGSLSRLKTDYLDICFIHSIGSLSRDKESEMKRLLDEEMLHAVDTLKKAGKMRFLAVSSHGYSHMEDLLMEAVRSGHFDVIMPAFNFMSFPGVPDVIKEAKKRGVGVVAMKTLAGANDMGLDTKGEDFEPAAFKWVLSHKEVSGLVISIKSVYQLNRYLTASGKELAEADRKILYLYAQKFGREYCRTGCNKCETSCPRNVEIAATLRYHMYFRNYGMEKRAMVSYARLDAKAESCLSCETRTCDGSCPYGLPVSALLRKAHDNLTIV